MPNPVDFSIETGRSDERDDLPFDLFYACGNENDPRFVAGRSLTVARPRRRARRRPAANCTCSLRGVGGAPQLAGAKYQRALELAGDRPQRQQAQRHFPLFFRSARPTRRQRAGGADRPRHRLRERCLPRANSSIFPALRRTSGKDRQADRRLRLSAARLRRPAGRATRRCSTSGSSPAMSSMSPSIAATLRRSLGRACKHSDPAARSDATLRVRRKSGYASPSRATPHVERRTP